MASPNVQNTNFDPYLQNITLLNPDGITSLTIPLSDVFSIQHTATITSIIFGVQLGMVAILLVVLMMMTKPKKLRSLIFMLNMLTLVLVLVRSILECVEIAGPFYNFYNWVAVYYRDSAAAQRESVVVEILSALVDATIELSLFLQMRVVCVTLGRFWLTAVTVLSMLVILTVVAVRFSLMVINIKWNILTVGDTTEAQYNLINRLASTANIAMMISIIFFSLVFCSKLAHAIMRRRKMGIKQFGPMQMIFVMGCQTLVVPAIFGCVTYVALKNELVHSFMAVVVAVSLPLSAIWASTNTSNVNIAAPCLQHNGRASNEVDSSTCKAGRQAIDGDGLSSTRGTLATLVAVDSCSDSTIKEPGNHVTARPSGDSVDLEFELMGRSNNVTSTYSINSRQDL